MIIRRRLVYTEGFCLLGSLCFDSFNPPLDDYSSQTCIYGGILPAGFFVYFVVIFFSNPVR
jgi:hypothetical protein